ncbi:hypothetical protein ACIQ7D_05680 [Streptomyces sp. NPDC096310]|uniref:hypothetical protein n=1 Tax=Streptomyces sp. NPDC096310 TaxID=3366082 RepID=UPI00380BD1AB
MRIHRTTPTRSFSTFTNALLRDRSISWCAAGVLMYLLSLPSGARVSIRSLAELRKEGRGRIAEALHELEESRYLRRPVVKNRESGQLSTVYEVFDHPHTNEGSDVAGDGGAEDNESGRNLASGDQEGGVSGSLPTGEKTGEQEPPSPVRERPRPVGQARRARQPKVTVPEQLRSATELLLSLGRGEPRLTLGPFEAVRLAPLVEEWRGCGASDAQVRQALTAGLPTPVLSAPGLIADRLRRKMPVPLPPRDPAAATSAPPPRAECEECRAPLPPSGAACRACAPPPLNAAARGFVDAAKRGGALVRAALVAPVVSGGEPGLA